MKNGIFSILFLLIAGLLVVQANISRTKNIPSKPNNPWRNPGTAPFKPKPLPGQWGRHRFSRQADQDKKNEQITFHVQKEGGKSSWDAKVQRNVWENKHGSVWVSGGANKQPHYKPQGELGIGGSFNWKN